MNKGFKNGVAACNKGGYLQESGTSKGILNFDTVRARVRMLGNKT